LIAAKTLRHIEIKAGVLENIFNSIRGRLTTTRYIHKMKRCRQAVLRTTVLGRKGKTVIRTPLVNRYGSRPTSKLGNQPREDFCSSTNLAQMQACVTNEQQDASGDEKECNIGKKRKIAYISNWEKVRDSLLTARIENACFPEESNCIVCKAEVATMRCEYCGPRQYFCLKCAQEIHAERNKFHVLEQWQVPH
jgi:hypothetical protein